MSEIIELSVHIDYLPEWDNWCVFREVVQNAKDAGKIWCSWKKNYIEIKDNGIGFDKKALLIGYSTKRDDDSNIGQFGEGMKFASLALVRQGHKIVIYSRGRMYEGMIIHSQKFDTKVLAFKVSDCKKIHGTVVKIFGLTRDEYDLFRTKIRFLSTGNTKEEISCSAGAILLNSEIKGRIYAKGIQVGGKSDRKLMYGYDFRDLKVDRDRRIPDNWSLHTGLGDMWLMVENEEMLEGLFRNFLSRECEEYQIKLWSWSGTSGARKRWKAVWDRFFGLNAVVCTNEKLRNELEYYGFRSVTIPESAVDFFAALVETDKKILEKLKGEAWEDLGPIDLSVYPILVKVREILNFDIEMRWFKDKAFNKDSGRRRIAFMRNNKMYVVEDKTDEIDMIESVIHERTHTYGLDDNTPGFQERYSDLWKDVFWKICCKGKSS